MADEEGNKFKDTILGKIPKDWNICKLGELATDVSYGYTTSATKDRVGPKFLRITDLLYHSINWDKVPFCKIDNKEKYKLEEGDIVIARTGASTGSFALIDKDYDAVFASYLIRFKFDKTLISPLYVSYILHSQLWTNFIYASIKGSAQPGINAKEMSEFMFPVPSLLKQQKIGNFLKTFDAKIELNQKMNMTLEAIAQAIFKHWFIDFEFPNEEGKPYKSSGGEMVDSELGEIPNNWTIKKLDEITDFLNGLPLQKYPAITEEDYLPVIKIKEMNSGISDSSDKASRYVPSEYIIHNGDILFGWSGSLGVTIWCSGEGALNQHIFKVSSDEYPKWFYYEWLLHYLPDFIEIARDKATTMGHIQRHHLSESLVAVPDSKTLEIMNNVLKPVIDRIIDLRVDSDTLTKIRDLLLPPLLSGKIRVPLEE